MNRVWNKGLFSYGEFGDMYIKRRNFVNESHLLIWGKLQLGLIR